MQTHFFSVQDTLFEILQQTLNTLSIGGYCEIFCFNVVSEFSHFITLTLP